MKTLAEKAASLGIPGLVLIYILHVSGFLGNALVQKLIAQFGPDTILEQIGELGLIAQMQEGLDTYGVDPLLTETLHLLEGKGYTKEQIMETIQSYEMTGLLKHKLLKKLDQLK